MATAAHPAAPGGAPPNAVCRTSREICLRRLAIVLGVLLVADALRSYHLGTQSLWYDEGFSVYVATHPWGQLYRIAASVDEHPPFYYALLHCFILAAGTSEYVVRYPALLAGVAVVPLTRALLRHAAAAFPTPARELAVLLGTTITLCSPVLVWFSQEARMYSQATAFGLAGSVYLLRLLARIDRGEPARRLAIGLAVADLLALYSHLYLGFLIATHAVVVAVWAWPATRRHRFGEVRVPVVALATVAVGGVPALIFALSRLGFDASYLSGTLPIGLVVHDTALMLIGGSTPMPMLQIALAVAAAAVALAVWHAVALPSGRRVAIWLPIAAALIPPILLYLLTWNRPKFSSRYLLFLAPYWYALVGIGLATFFCLPRRLPRRAAATCVTAACALLLVANSLEFRLVWTGQEARDNWRAVAAFIRDHGGTNNPIVLVSGHAFPVFLYYAPWAHWLGLPAELTLSTRRTLTLADATTINRFVGTSRRMWVVRWEANVVDPTDVLDLLLRQRAHELLRGNPSWGVNVREYDLSPGRFSANPQARDYDVGFGTDLKLVGSDIARGAMRAPSGGRLRLRLFWMALRPVHADLHVSLRLLDAHGHDWGSTDGRPAGEFNPTYRWTAGDTIFGDTTVPVVAGTPPGRYQLTVTVYDPHGGQIGAPALLGNVNIEPPGRPLLPSDIHPAVALVAASGVQPSRQPGGSPPPASSSGVGQPAGSTVASGDALVPLGLRTPLPTAVGAGGSFDLQVYWLALTSRTAVPHITITLRDAAGAVTRKQAPSPTTGGGPYNWPAGTVELSQDDVNVPAGAKPGPAAVSISADGGSAIELGSVRIDPRPTPPPVAPPQHVLHTRFSDGIEIVGYDEQPSGSVAAGQQLRVTLHWRATATPRRDWTVFVHILRPNGTVAAQNDGQPAGGAFPTTAWVAGEQIADTHTLTVPADLARSRCGIEVGLYDATTGTRDPTEAGANRVLLRPVTISGAG